MGFEILSEEKVGREYAVAGDTEAIEKGLESLVQRAGGRHPDEMARFMEAYGLDAHLAALERQKVDIHFARGKMGLGRFVCLEPACPGPEIAASGQAGVSRASVRRARNGRENSRRAA